MKWLMVALMTMTLSLVACEKDKVEPQPEPTPTPEPEPQPNPTELTFELQVVDTTKTEAIINVTPSDIEAGYLVLALDAKTVDSYDNDAEVIAKIYADVESYAEANDTTLEEYLAPKVKHGLLEGHKVENLNMATSYYILVFGVDVEAEFATTSKLFKQEFTTEASQQSSCTFDLKAVVNSTNVAITVKPSDNNQLWHIVNTPVEEYQSYTSEDGEYGWTKDEFFQNYLNTEISLLKGQGLTNDEINIKLFHKGMRTLNDSGLVEKSKYVVFAAAVDYADGEACVTSALKELRYNSGEAAQSNLTFDIDVFNIEHYSAEVRITPSDPNAEYFYHVGYINQQKKNMKPVEIAEMAVTEGIYYWENYTELKHKDPVTGVVELTGDNKLELNIAETEYYIVAFSYDLNPTYGTIDEATGEYDTNPGTITSAPVYVSFMTAEQGDPMTAEFTFSASDVGPYDFYLEINAEDPTIYYQPGIAYAENFNPEAAISASSANLKMLMEMCMTGQSPSLTIHEALEEKLTSYYRNGSGKYYIANLEPNRNYIGYVLAINAKTGEFARCVYSDVIATTTNVGSVTPSVELLGVYNGDDEYGEIFGNKEMTAGRPIIAVKYNNIDNATAVYTALSTDPAVDVAALAARYVISEFRGVWQPIFTMEVPYYFFVADWDVEQTVVSYAQDANGHEGGVGILGVKPVGSDDIEELKGYVQEVNDATAQSAAKSLVIAEDIAEPSMECIWSEAVGAPRAAEVTYHAVEPLQNVVSDLVDVRVVKSFRL